MWNRLALLAASLMIVAAAPSVAAPVNGCAAGEAAAGKSPPRKPATETRERKRPAQSSVARGCVGCISPLDSISSAMAVRTLN
jgi:hypothetical protein